MVTCPGCTLPLPIRSLDWLLHPTTLKRTRSWENEWIFHEVNHRFLSLRWCKTTQNPNFWVQYTCHVCRRKVAWKPCSVVARHLHSIPICEQFLLLLQVYEGSNNLRGLYPNWQVLCLHRNSRKTAFLFHPQLNKRNIKQFLYMVVFPSQNRKD